MRKVSVAVIMVCASLLSGCMATPSATQLSSAYYGDLPVSYKDDIKNAIRISLKDPYSAEYYFGEPKKAYLQGGLVENFKMYYGWVVPVSFNAKNSFGAYVGYKTQYFMFVDNRFFDATLKFKSGYAKEV